MEVKGLLFFPLSVVYIQNSRLSYNITHLNQEKDVYILA